MVMKVSLNFSRKYVFQSNAPGRATGFQNTSDAPKSCSPWTSFDNGSCITPQTSLLNLLEPGGGEAATSLNSGPPLKGATKHPPVKKSDERLIQRPQVLNPTRSGRITAGRFPEQQTSSQQIVLRVNSQFSKSVRQLNQLASAKYATVSAPTKRGRRIHNASSAVVNRSSISANATQRRRGTECKGTSGPIQLHCLVAKFTHNVSCPVTCSDSIPNLL
ncbi:hypothetical protein CRM22_009228 [Opisthorchis felineus]|uniref:Uncharacterized protein n=1 Tax=Opisthorchis felineus TaxID=147828 RepID=A0A4S2LFN0_OPIFE|nr:hypothetical protein CRM22_009228 [Opisthorchis felineus]